MKKKENETQLFVWKSSSGTRLWINSRDAKWWEKRGNHYAGNR